jgi:DNA primase
MVNEVLISLVDRVLGKGKATARDNRAYNCPFCNHHKPKLEVSFKQQEKGENPWNCWVCGKKGRSLLTLFNKIQASERDKQELIGFIKANGGRVSTSTKEEIISLPKEFRELTTITKKDIIGRHALRYLKDRGLSKEDILKYGIGYCETGPYAKMIIIPSYTATGILNYFIARNFDANSPVKYKNPSASKDIVGFEMFINWNLPVILCEGVFDAIAVKRNVIPLFGKFIPKNLMKKIVSSQVEKVYIALDKDAQKQALEHCKQLLDLGKEVYLLDMEDKDPSEMGFTKFTTLIQNAIPMTYRDLLTTKINTI